MSDRSYVRSLAIDCPHCGHPIALTLDLHADGGAVPVPPLALLVLTPEQVAVVIRIARGEPRKVIAHDLGIALATVNLRIRCARIKAGCKTRAELIVRAEQSGLLGADPT